MDCDDWDGTQFSYSDTGLGQLTGYHRILIKYHLERFFLGICLRRDAFKNVAYERQSQIALTFDPLGTTLSLMLGGRQDEIILLGAAKIVTRC